MLLGQIGRLLISVVVGEIVCSLALNLCVSPTTPILRTIMHSYTRSDAVQFLIHENSLMYSLTLFSVYPSVHSLDIVTISLN